jgi:hypothetical protein
MPSDLTLRDHFAALAMQRMLTHKHYAEWSCADIAECAYKQADEMLKARSQDAL